MFEQVIVLFERPYFTLRASSEAVYCGWRVATSMSVCPLNY